jgi:hypothetical protein
VGDVPGLQIVSRFVEVIPVPKYRYRVGDSTQDFEIETSTSFEDHEGDWLAELAAEDYHGEHDGWEGAWPIELHLFDGDTPLGSYKIEMDVVPEFTASRR